MAASLVSQINRLLDTSLTFMSLFEAPSVAELAGVIDREGWSRPASSVITVQPHGSNPPLFLVTTPFACYQLASYLGTDQPIYEVMKTELDGSRLPFPQFRELAAQVIPEIKGIQPQGPYFVGGFSGLGGNLALEIAHQLLARGDDVGLLALFDFALPGEGHSLMDRLGYHVKQMGHLGLKDRAAYVLQLMKLRGTVRRAVYRAHKATGRQVPGALQDTRWARQTALVHGVGFERRSFPSRISLFRARDRVHAVESEDLGWSEVAAGGLEVHEIPGDHNGIFAEPNIEELANRLRESLALARDDPHADATPGSEASDTQR